MNSFQITRLSRLEDMYDRNRIFHQFRQYISDCHFSYLAQQICHDLKELLNVASDEETTAKYETVLLTALF